MTVSVDSVTVHGGNQADRGGSIPASTLHLWIGETSDAQNLVETYHYSHRWPSNIQLVVTAHESGGLFGNKGEALAAVVFSIPGNQWSFPVWELCRLVRKDDSRVPLSWLIARSVNVIKRKRLAHLLVSFADAQQGHHGGVYKASNWHYNGLRAPRIEGVFLGDEYIPQRVCRHRFGTSLSTTGVIDRARKSMGLDFIAKSDEGKHLYWLAMDRIGEGWATKLSLRRRVSPPTEVA